MDHETRERLESETSGSDQSQYASSGDPLANSCSSTFIRGFLPIAERREYAKTQRIRTLANAPRNLNFKLSEVSFPLRLCVTASFLNFQSDWVFERDAGSASPCRSNPR